MIGKNKVFIIAEAGVNHNGSFDLALQLVDVAVAVGADAVKFQTWKTEKIITRQSKKVPYQKEDVMDQESQYEMLKRHELSFEDFQKLKTYCDEKNIIFFSTADEIESATFLNTIQDIFKIGSSELTDLPYLRKIVQFGKPIILSTGMGSLEGVQAAMTVLLDGGLAKDEITLLHCSTAYPTPYSDVNLKAMLTLREEFGVTTGYSDHSLGIEVPIAAVALGARVIEKHFTLNKNMDGPDHKISLEPDEFVMMVKAIRNVELALGDGIKMISDSEKENIPFIRKSIVAGRKITKGEIIGEENITVKRPGGGINPSQWHNVIGKTAIRDFQPDEIIEL